MQIGNWTEEWSTTKQDEVLLRRPLYKPTTSSTETFSEDFSTSLISKTSYDMVFQVSEGVDYKVNFVKADDKKQLETLKLEIREQNNVVMIRFGMFEVLENIEQEFNFQIDLKVNQVLVGRLTSPNFKVRPKSLKRIKREVDLQPTTKVQKLLNAISALPEEKQVEVTRSIFKRSTFEQKTRLRNGSTSRSC
jgi:hypothetical protein